MACPCCSLLRCTDPPVSVRACVATPRPVCATISIRGLGRREYYAWALRNEWSQLAAAPAAAHCRDAAAHCRDAAARLRRGQRHRPSAQPSAFAAPSPPKQHRLLRLKAHIRVCVGAGGGAVHLCMLQHIVTRSASSAVSSAVFAVLSASACPTHCPACAVRTQQCSAGCTANVTL